jgi:hypothetical protein
MIPPGAVSVEGTYGGDSGFFTWVTLDGAELKQFGFNIPIATVRKGGSTELFGFVPLPQPLKDKTPFKSMSLMYLPTGHAPAGVYDIPHWEWHLNTLTEPEINAIDCKDTRTPTQDKLPPNVVCFPTCLEKLGMHAFNLGNPEFQGARFTYGVYGSYYKADFFAVEPKLTTTTLLEHKTFTMPSFDPSPLGAPGKYPKEWNVSYNTENDSVVLTVDQWVTK